MKKIAAALAVSAVLLGLLSPLCFAQQQQSLTPQQAAFIETLKTAAIAAGKAATRGPAQVPLIDQGTLDLPQGYMFIPSKEAADLMRAVGNDPGQGFIGMVLSPTDQLRWFITINFLDTGYVRDDDARDWKADDLLSSILDKTEEANKARTAKGLPTLDVLGWMDPPAYDDNTHKLVWAVLAQNHGGNSKIVNYNTLALGRSGIFRLKLITPSASISDDKAHALAILAGLHYNPGKDYNDFTEGSDKVAEYGLAALITGVAAKKVGLLAVIGALLAKAAKVALVASLLFIKKIKAFFTRRKGGTDTLPPA